MFKSTKTPSVLTNDCGNSRDPLKFVALISIGLLLVVLMQWLMPYTVIADEAFHLAQISVFSGSDWYLIPQLAMPRTYHWIMGTVSQLFAVQSISGVRLISALYSYIAVILAWWYLKQNKPSFPLIQALQLLAAPLIWPFFWVLYTDIPSLASIILALILLNTYRYRLAAIVCVISLLFRQHNIFWVLLIWCAALGQEGVWSELYTLLSTKDRRKNHQVYQALRLLYQGIKKTAVFLIPIVLFMAFLVWNQGIAVGDRENQQFGSIYPLQIFFCLLLFGLMALPLHLANLSKIFKLLSNRLWPWLILVICFVVYMLTFKIVHPHNFPSDYFLRNELLYYLQGHFRYKVLSYSLIALSLMSLMVTPLRFTANYWLYPITFLALLPISLIEQRYYIVPFCLLMLWRRPYAQWIEIILLCWFAILSAVLTWGIVSMRFFL